MSEIAPISIISEDALLEKVESGLLVPLGANENLQLVDCGDRRPLTTESLQQRRENMGREIVPTRYLGGASGLTLTAITAFASQAGEQGARGFLGGINAETFTDFAADLTNRAKRQKGIDIHQHSADSNEGNPLHIAHDHKDRESPLGCALAANIGAIAHKATEPGILLDAQAIACEAGLSFPLREAQEGVQVLADHVPKALSIHRGALHHAITKSKYHTPIAILKDVATTPDHDDLAVVIDFAQYRSQADGSKYHHTPAIASEQLPELLPEFAIDKELMAASALLVGAATRAVLSGEDTPNALPVELIPAEYAAA